MQKNIARFVNLLATIRKHPEICAHKDGFLLAVHIAALAQPEDFRAWLFSYLPPRARDNIVHKTPAYMTNESANWEAQEIRHQVQDFLSKKITLDELCNYLWGTDARSYLQSLARKQLPALRPELTWKAEDTILEILIDDKQTAHADDLSTLLITDEEPQVQPNVACNARADTPDTNATTKSETTDNNGVPYWLSILVFVLIKAILGTAGIKAIGAFLTWLVLFFLFLAGISKCLEEEEEKDPRVFFVAVVVALVASLFVTFWIFLYLLEAAAR